MNENMEKLCQVLESGKYQQTTAFLHNDGKFCCLGVACDLYREITGIGEWKDHQHGQNKLFALPREGGDFTHHGTTLPNQVRDFFGFKSHVGDTKKYTESDQSRLREGPLRLTKLNDDGKSFKEIATAIRSGDYCD